MFNANDKETSRTSLPNFIFLRLTIFYSYEIFHFSRSKKIFPVVLPIKVQFSSNRDTVINFKSSSVFSVTIIHGEALHLGAFKVQTNYEK